MIHMKSQRDLLSFLAGLLPAFGSEISAHDSIPTDQTDLLVYQSDFSTPAGTEWSSNSISPSLNRDFLGEFTTNSGITLNLIELPKHRSVNVVFDLLVSQKWEKGIPSPKGVTVE